MERPWSPGPWLEIPETPALHPEVPRTPIPKPGGAESWPLLLGRELLPQTAATFAFPLDTPRTPADTHEDPTTPTWRLPPVMLLQPLGMMQGRMLPLPPTPTTPAETHEVPTTPGAKPEIPRTPIPRPGENLVMLPPAANWTLPPTTPAPPRLLSFVQRLAIPRVAPKAPIETQTCPFAGGELEIPNTPIPPPGIMQGMMHPLFPTTPAPCCDCPWIPTEHPLTP